MVKKESIKINHPEFGHVMFENMTPRQMDVLKILEDTMKVWNKKKKNQLKMVL